MAQYTNTTTSSTGGFIANAVLDSVTNLITIVGMKPDGSIVGTSSIDATAAANNPSSLLDIVVSLRDQWTAIEIVPAAELGAGTRQAVQTSVNDVIAQAKVAQTAAEATGTPVPQEGNAIPVAPPSDPNIAAAAAAQSQSSNQTVAAQNPVLSQAQAAAASPAGTQTTDTPVPQVIVTTPTGTVLITPAVIVPTGQVALDPKLEPNLKPNTIVDKTSGNAASAAASTSASVGNIAPNPGATGAAQGAQGAQIAAKASATAQDQANLDRTKDWRVRLQLGPGATYLYNATDPGILKPLKYTDGIIFPYTPSIAVTYASNYDASDIVHSNYKIYQYRSSSVDNITITCDFTAQDTYEANYLLATIHFLRSVTKMFYGQDEDPKNGTPPPICFLSGFGEYQFNKHPLVISNFTYNLPNDIDYIRADLQIGATTPNPTGRLTNIRKGGAPAPVTWTSPTNNTVTPTYVPTKMQIVVQAIPLVTRNAVSKIFSLKNYATGSLLRGSTKPGGYFGGIW